ncbi:MAG: glycogen debranching enzyme, partial [Microcystaceae cyanobacterium]
CQDNELSWFDWSAIEKQADLLGFVKRLIQYIQALEIFRQERLLEVTYGSYEPHIVWHGVKLGQPDWSDNSHSLAFTLRHPAANEHLYVILNAYWQPLTFEMPLLEPGEDWHRLIDTALPTPDDCCDLETAPPIKKQTYQVEAHSSVVLMVKGI